MSETDTLRQVQVAFSRLGARLFRMTVGHFITQDGRHIRTGTPGMADLVGWFPVTVTPAMVGKRLAVFCAIEVKSDDGTATAEQTAFLATVRKAGGIAAVTRSPEDFPDDYDPFRFG